MQQKIHELTMNSASMNKTISSLLNIGVGKKQGTHSPKTDKSIEIPQSAGAVSEGGEVQQTAANKIF